MKITQQEISELAKANGYEYAALKAVIDVESSGNGFSDSTGKIIIQFEPLWFKRNFARWKENRIHTKWLQNKVSNQSLEWLAFNDAYLVNADAAMQSTSIGMMQVMCFHYRELGFKTVGEMWDWAKLSEANQVEIGIRFIKSKPLLDNALKFRKWPVFSFYYNGKNYKDFHYDTRLDSAYEHNAKLPPSVLVPNFNV